MKIAVLKERLEGESRVAATPETVKKMRDLGASVRIEKNAGLASNYRNEDYQAAGVEVVSSLQEALEGADLVLKVQRPLTFLDGEDEVKFFTKKGMHVVGLLSPYAHKDALGIYAAQNLTTYALEFVPRITRAQSMDVLSSQSNLAGYRAVIEACYEFGRAFPMMMTAAGTIAPAKVLVLGAGVAGLQAIATAKRLGAVVFAFDVRSAAKEQVQSLGATFVEVDAEEGGDGLGGYAKEMSKDYQARQAQKIKETLAKVDIVISTALIPGKPAPKLITEDMVKAMKEGSVIVDMAVETGGNCALSEIGKCVKKNGVTIIGYSNLPARIAQDASALYARNILNFVSLFFDKENKVFSPNLEDEIIKATLMTHEGQIVHPQFKN